MAAGYMGRDRVPISGIVWKTRRPDREYTIIRAFENERLRVTAEWYGAITNGAAIPHVQRKPFRLLVINIITTDGEGRALERPLRMSDRTASREFRFEHELIDAYEEDILVRFGGCEWLPSSDWQSGRQFVERGQPSRSTCAGCGRRARYGRGCRRNRWKLVVTAVDFVWGAIL
ncbi:hypothetical protein [Burkholderia sp. BDU5]|uniref:hypothetical protein n=1 Tax=Burkholderia sp. BDU5 TaxID=1385590 RepID=UPI0007553BC3|nr:hypothetical protein [Burkholderia sp. BDU5]KVE36828.1 hypothetical protein WS69_11680 [Burkholderia sp. BDU5]